MTYNIVPYTVDKILLYLLFLSFDYRSLHFCQA